MKYSHPTNDGDSIWKTLNETDRYYAYFEKIDGVEQSNKLVKKIAIKNLRKDPCIIPLESTIVQQDSRKFKSPESFYDIPGCLYNEEKKQ